MTTAPIPAEIEILLSHVARRNDGFQFFRNAPIESVAVLFEVPPPVVATAREYLETPEQRERLTEYLLRARLVAREASDRALPSDAGHSELQRLEPKDVIAELEGYPAGSEFLLRAPPETLAILFQVPPSVIFRARDLLNEEGS